MTDPQTHIDLLDGNNLVVSCNHLDDTFKVVMLGGIVLLCVGYAWLQTAKSKLDANVGLWIMLVGLVDTIAIGVILLYYLIRNLP